jgi:hypothetical protein
MLTWHQALKQWNGTKDKWCIPRKGTAEHAEVRALMGVAKKKSKKSTKPKKSTKTTKSKKTAGEEYYDKLGNLLKNLQTGIQMDEDAEVFQEILEKDKNKKSYQQIMDEIEGKPKKKLTQKSKSVPVKKKLPPQPKSKSVSVKKETRRIQILENECDKDVENNYKTPLKIKGRRAIYVPKKVINTKGVEILCTKNLSDADLDISKKRMEAVGLVRGNSADIPDEKAYKFINFFLSQDLIIGEYGLCKDYEEVYKYINYRKYTGYREYGESHIASDAKLHAVNSRKASGVPRVTENYGKRYRFFIENNKLKYKEYSKRVLELPKGEEDRRTWMPGTRQPNYNYSPNSKTFYNTNYDLNSTLPEKSKLPNKDAFIERSESEFNKLQYPEIMPVHHSDWYIRNELVNKIYPELHGKEKEKKILELQKENAMAYATILEKEEYEKALYMRLKAEKDAQKKLTQKSKSKPKPKSKSVKKKSLPQPKSKSTKKKIEEPVKIEIETEPRSESTKKEIYENNSIFNKDILVKIIKLYNGIKSKREVDELRKLVKHDKFIETIEGATRAFDFFPTPLKCIDDLNIDVSRFESFLEPSCGFGSVLYYILNKDYIDGNEEYEKYGVKYTPIKSTAYELMENFEPFLKEHFPKTNIHIGDFLKSDQSNNDFDLIVCNPPFTDVDFSNKGDRKYYLRFLFKCLFTLHVSKSKTYGKLLYFISPPLTKEKYKKGATIDASIIMNLLSKSKKKELTDKNSDKYIYHDLDELSPVQVTYKGDCTGFSNTNFTVSMYEIIV